MPYTGIHPRSMPYHRTSSKHRREQVKPEAVQESASPPTADSTEPIGISQSESTVVRLGEDLILSILEGLSAKELIRLKTVSRSFACTISHLLRARFRCIACSPSYELLLESCPPTAAIRQDHRQAIQFDSFVHQPESQSIELAQFTFDQSYLPIPQYITLDDDQQFGNNLLALYVRTRFSPPSSSSTQVARDRSLGESETATSRARTSGGGASPSTSRRSPSPRDYSWTLAVANGMDRLFRSWFERSDLPSDSTTSELHRAERPKATKMIKPTSVCALHSAQIACYLVHGIARNPAMAYPTIQDALPKRFEFEYESVKVDVARLVVAVEEGMRRSGVNGRIIVWFRA